MKFFVYLSIFAVLIFTLSTFSQNAHAASITVPQSGNWDDPVTWLGSIGLPPGASMPASGDRVIIPSGVTLTVPPGFTVTNSITIDSGGTLINSGTINNSNKICNSGRIDNLPTGHINNIRLGSVIYNSGDFICNSNKSGKIFNEGTITNNRTIYNGNDNGFQIVTGIITNEGNAKIINNNEGHIYNSAKSTIINMNNFATNTLGQIINSGNISNEGIIHNMGTITNFATDSNYGFLNSGEIDNSIKGTITNIGTIINTGSYIWNKGTINNFYSSNNQKKGGIINNENAIIPDISGEHIGTITNTGTINNDSGTITNSCTSVITKGTFWGNPIINIPCTIPAITSYSIYPWIIMLSTMTLAITAGMLSLIRHK